jgi:sporulation inhibitor KapD
MKKIIWSVSRKKNIFYIIMEGKRVGFYLTNRLAKMFMPYLKQGVMVDFRVTGKTKKIGHEIAYQVAYFMLVTSLNPNVVHYDLMAMRAKMQEVLAKHDHYVFIDFEMTMPGYQRAPFRPEIIQVGYVVAKAKGEVITSGSSYVLPKTDKVLSKRTRRFLKIEDEAFFSQAVPYMTFYKQLAEIDDKYHPKYVVWGKNDITALSDSYQLNEQKPLTTDTDFIDLLKLHKDYFNLKDDLGLFKAYKGYYGSAFEQCHDAKDDALVTKYVFDAFIIAMENGIDTEDIT